MLTASPEPVPTIESKHVVGDYLANVIMAAPMGPVVEMTIDGERYMLNGCTIEPRWRDDPEHVTATWVLRADFMAAARIPWAMLKQMPWRTVAGILWHRLAHPS